MDDVCAISLENQHLHFPAEETEAQRLGHHINVAQLERDGLGHEPSLSLSRVFAEGAVTLLSWRRAP